MLSFKATTLFLFNLHQRFPEYLSYTVGLQFENGSRSIEYFRRFIFTLDVDNISACYYQTFSSWNYLNFIISTDINDFWLNNVFDSNQKTVMSKYCYVIGKCDNRSKFLVLRIFKTILNWNVKSFDWNTDRKSTFAKEFYFPTIVLQYE